MPSGIEPTTLAYQDDTRINQITWPGPGDLIIHCLNWKALLKVTGGTIKNCSGPKGVNWDCVEKLRCTDPCSLRTSALWLVLHEGESAPPALRTISPCNALLGPAPAVRLH